ncbi:threonine-phosphate decarboxylase [Peribacillus saganii]|uniref:threonine-phosphate decarboxylase n=1 Tax=Peribacillus saganii TaxID=2303992 RepID=A0A372LU34_9BACI|nr:threonine-phosphate decarboxylase CobD [Peribacillus saganii]RFU71407.1 threonine-phosphate decarboxylase [Peribacillus saganii]
MKLPSHGSNPHYLYNSLGIEMPEHYVDFSANINPLGPPPALLEEWKHSFHYIHDYPDPQASVLTKKIAAMEGVPEQSVLVGNGGAEIISLVARWLAGKRVMIVQPAFSEYETACLANGCRVTWHMLEEGVWELELPALDGIDAIFLCTPNNPTGIEYSPQAVVHLIQECSERGVYVIIDEAFYDFLEEAATYTAHLPDYSNLIILRSLTKMYSIPGLRLGYLMADQEIVSRISAYRPHWSVNALALMAGEICMDAEDHVKRTREMIESERLKLKDFYDSSGFIMSKSSINFYLLREPDTADASGLLRFLLENGIVPRHTFNFPGLSGRWLRFAVKTGRDNSSLMEVLNRWRKEE